VNILGNNFTLSIFAQHFERSDSTTVVSEKNKHKNNTQISYLSRANWLSKLFHHSYFVWSSHSQTCVQWRRPFALLLCEREKNNINRCLQPLFILCFSLALSFCSVRYFFYKVKSSSSNTKCVSKDYRPAVSGMQIQEI
jgi:hypothetical protein